jgi:hypothetical protein
LLLARVLERQTLCLHQLAQGQRSQEVRFGRFLANPKVTLQRLIEGWSQSTQAAVAGRHILAIQDTSEINFHTRPGQRRGLGEIGKGSGGHGVLLHAMLAVDAAQGHCLGLVGGSIYTRQGRVQTPHAKRALKDKESRRWIDTAVQARPVLAQAAMVTEISDREGDIYAAWAQTPGGQFHRLTRVMHDRAVAGGGTLSSQVSQWSFVGVRRIELLATHTRARREAELSVRFGQVEVMRPDGPDAKQQPASIELRLIEVVERNAPADVEPVHWRLLTTHEVADEQAAWQVVQWYRLRWTIEQMFRLVKLQGLRLEDSQLSTAEGLLKLSAIAAKAATMTLQLTQAREGKLDEPASNVFDASEMQVLQGLHGKVQGKTALQKNPHPRDSLGWAAWIIAKLGGWDGYPSSKPPGPITFRNGLEYFQTIARGWALRDVCMP